MIRSPGKKRKDPNLNSEFKIYEFQLGLQVNIQ